MISVYKLKTRFQKLLQPLLLGLRNLGISPNALTVFGLVLSCGIAYAFTFYQSKPVVLLFCAFGLLVRMAVNALDGMMAVQFSLQSKLGELLNELCDVLSDLVIALPLFLIPGVSNPIILAFIILAIVNEFAGVLAKAISGVRRYDGPMGKSDRAFLLGLFFIVSYFWPTLTEYSNWIFGFASLLMVLSTFIRLKKAVAE